MPSTTWSTISFSHFSGLNFLVRQIPDEVFTYDERRTEAMMYEEMPKELFPYLVHFLRAASTTMM
jgi:pantothenate kinase